MRSKLVLTLSLSRSLLLRIAPSWAQPLADAAPMAMPLAAAASAAPEVRFAIIKTGKVRVREGLLFSGGSFAKQVDTNFSAFLIQHHDSLFLFDSGLGERVADQYRQDMPYWNRPFFRYEQPVRSAVAQLKAAGVAPIRRIVLSHGHWDHASGLEDFPGAEVLLSDEELAYVRQPKSKVGGAWPSQVVDKALSWQALRFAPLPHEGFERSLDLFGDGTVVLVPMYGHTPGSVGLFLTVSSGQRYFFVGDVVWSASALQQGRPKIWPARALVDHDAARTQATIDQIRAVMQRDPGITIVPAHDGQVQDRLGYFPAWVR